MRVAFFADSFREDLGGLTRAVIQMHDLLLRHGAAVRVYTLPQTGGPVHPGDVVSVPALPLNALPGMPPDSWLAVGHRQVLRSLRDWRPDVVHLHTPFPVSRLGLRAARTLGVPSVATYHANVDALGAYPGGKLARRLAWHLAAGLYNGCDLVLAPSAFALQQLRRGGVTRPIVVLSNGVDLDRFAPGHFAPDLEDRRGLASAQGEPAVVATYAGRLSPEKGTRLLAETCRLALDEEQRLRVRLVGMGPDLARLRRRLGVLADRVEIGGAVAGSECHRCMQRQIFSSSLPPARRRAWPCWRRWPPGCRSWPWTPGPCRRWWCTARPACLFLPATPPQWLAPLCAWRARPRSGCPWGGGPGSGPRSMTCSAAPTACWLCTRS